MGNCGTDILHLRCAFVLIVDVVLLVQVHFKTEATVLGRDGGTDHLAFIGRSIFVHWQLIKRR
jgi:hypothetical protein